eukprot:COSAG05_NODE_2761_length_2671_cov_60.035756_1_plen_89_part_00
MGPSTAEVQTSFEDLVATILAAHYRSPEPRARRALPRPSPPHGGSDGGGSYDGEEATSNDKARLDALTAEWGMKVRGGAGLGAYSASV